MPKSNKANDSMLIPTMGIPQGWQCPVCRKVHAPHVNSCDCHERVAGTGSTNVTLIGVSGSTNKDALISWGDWLQGNTVRLR